MDSRAARLVETATPDPAAGPSPQVRFGSILFADQQAREEEVPQPDYFVDLSLDQIIAGAIEGRDHYRLATFFHRPLSSLEDVGFRQAVVSDLQREEQHAAVSAFAAAMQQMRDRLARADKHRHHLQKQASLIEAACAYCDGLAQFEADMNAHPPQSQGMGLWRTYLAAHLAAEPFQTMRARAHDVLDALAGVRFTIMIRDLHVRIDPFDGQADYGAMIAESYARFAQGGEGAFSFRSEGGDELNYIEGRILDEVARAFPEPFGALKSFVTDYGLHFYDDLVASFDREIQFYIAYLDWIAPLRDGGLAFCLPEVIEAKDVHADDCFDLSLARKLMGSGETVVPNSFRLEGRERIFIVSGPNQGGKTTFARQFGQLHHIACLGLPVPGRSAQLHLFDRIFTHFERREIAASPNGKLQDELVRMHAILDAARPESIIIMNELFASTTFRDAKMLSEKVTARLVELDLLCVWVSFIDGLSELSDTMVSMVSGVDPEDPTRRTYRVERREADGLAYARAIARKYGLTRQQIEERLKS